MKLFVIALLLPSLAAGPGSEAVPANPCATLHLSRMHWVNRLPWDKRVNAAGIKGLVRQDNSIDSAVLADVESSLSTRGGGVLYFPSGTYFFNFDCPLKAGVILAGDPPRDTLLGLPAASWATHFVFPKLALNFRNRPPDADSLCFNPKKIFLADTSGAFAGLADLDINRARISLEGTDQVLVYRIRLNNTAALRRDIPTAYQRGSGQGWQIWPDNTVPSIAIRFKRRCLVAGCVINDAITDSLPQPDYLASDGMHFDRSDAVFRFTSHPGLRISGEDGRVSVAESMDNFIATEKGYPPFVVSACVSRDRRDSTELLPAIASPLQGGAVSTRTDYDILYEGRYPSEARSFVSVYGDTLAYRLIRPEHLEAGRRYPLVIFLHDFWEKGSDDKRQMRQFIWQLATPENREKYPCFILAPQLPADEPKWKSDGLGSNTWPLQCTDLLCTELSRTLPIDTTRLYLTGESMGAAGVVSMVLQNQGKYAAALCISAFYVLTRNASDELSHTPMWFIYGAEDEKIRPTVRLSLRTNLRAAHANARFTELPGMGHRCWNDLLEKEPGVFDWLFAQHR
jgi:hypothetical protein